MCIMHTSGLPNGKEKDGLLRLNEDATPGKSFFYSGMGFEYL